MKNLSLLPALVVGLIISGCSEAQTPPFNANVGSVGHVPVIYLQSTIDDATLNSFEINRGNCKGNFMHQMPTTFTYGAEAKIYAHGCKILELLVETNKGSFTYTFR